MLILPNVNQRIADGVTIKNNPGDGTDVKFNSLVVVYFAILQWLVDTVRSRDPSLKRREVLIM